MLRRGNYSGNGRYLFGLGLGLVIGAMFGHSSNGYPTFIIVWGAIFAVLGTRLSIKEENGKK